MGCTVLKCRMILNYELERMCKEYVVAYFKELYQNLPEGTKKRHIKSKTVCSACLLISFTFCDSETKSLAKALQ
jgi:hypothetical protein